jgi:hypothetical protein
VARYTLIKTLLSKDSKSYSKMLHLVFSLIELVLEYRRRSDPYFAVLVAKEVNIFEKVGWLVGSVGGVRPKTKSCLLF